MFLLSWITKLENHWLQCLENLERIFRWIPILWNLREWDDASLPKVICFHLCAMAGSLENDPWHDQKKNARRARTVVEHFYRSYNPPAQKIYHVDMIRNSKGYIDFNKIPKPGSLFWKSQYEQQDRLEKYHWESAWKIMSKYGRKWWT